MRRLLPALFAFAILPFAGICPICIDQGLKSQVKVSQESSCIKHVSCPENAVRTEEHWDDKGEYHPVESCYDCSAGEYKYKCTQGHSFETLTDERKITNK